ncbi:hypothetical protein [Novosphingobium sp. ST904]|uniref:hypothetical protein n=1 Tax=Novosphingobium sp. ST904 TaxID=1684385 RepID=UPI0006C8E473|nr:hypothetical protein [Novosphingobium sp. ST904]KPH67535.1 hypothetical protein ADT71_02215 [Novosphingobium sp. ST904]TCM30039.1 hypothetical protein EDF59_12766 [Novosphingobium sp. ST904]
MIARLRNRHGRFLRKLVPTPADDRCWLIWSVKWHMWLAHDGRFTHVIAEAGLYDYAAAKRLHDGIAAEAFHVSEKVDLITMQLIDVRRLLGALEEKADAARQVAA